MGKERFIPTCVGRFSCRRSWARLRPVHPHVRGAVFVCASVEALSSGSSPRAWGGCEPRRQTRSHARFIPTCVGRFLNPCPIGRGCSVHPHVRGAVGIERPLDDRVVGSSPRAWGGFEWARVDSWSGRFIPTCVGRFAISAYLQHMVAGSSPRAWGGFPPQPNARCASRFIPTCVGRLITLNARETGCSVHPHVRGAVRRQGVEKPKSFGSSPRAWGG